MLLYFSDVPGLKLTPFNYSINMSVYYIASLKISYFIAQNLGNKAKPRDNDPPGYFRSLKYPGTRLVRNVLSQLCLEPDDIQGLDLSGYSPAITLA